MSKFDDDPCFSGRGSGPEVRVDPWYRIALEKKARRAAEEHASRLSNRVKQLQKEEERAKKLTKETQKKADAVLAARQRNEEILREKEAHQLQREEQLRKAREQILVEKQKQDALRRRGLRKSLKEKVEQAEETREERAAREREVANLKVIDAVGALERKDFIRHQQEVSLLKQKQFWQDRIRATKETYLSSVEKEREARLQKEKDLQGLAQEELRLLERLRIRQEEQARAEARLQAAVASSSRRWPHLPCLTTSALDKQAKCTCAHRSCSKQRVCNSLQEVARGDVTEGGRKVGWWEANGSN
eukprot:jgi/Botrbrau1/4427/Bobra.0348s0017.2